MVPGALEAFFPALPISADDLAGLAEQRLDVAVKAWPGRKSCASSRGARCLVADPRSADGARTAARDLGRVQHPLEEARELQRPLDAAGAEEPGPLPEAVAGARELIRRSLESEHLADAVEHLGRVRRVEAEALPADVAHVGAPLPGM